MGCKKRNNQKHHKEARLNIELWGEMDQKTAFFKPQ